MPPTRFDSPGGPLQQRLESQPATAEASLPNLSRPSISAVLCLCPDCFQEAIWDFVFDEPGPLCIRCEGYTCTETKSYH